MCSAQQGVTDSVNKHIGIRVSQETTIVFKAYATQPQFAILGKLMNIKSKSYTYFHNY